MEKNIYLTIKNLVARVNNTLSYYEKDYISVKRTPFSERERCTSFEQYIEARFNFECYQIPELRDAILATEGHLFSCISLENPDTFKRRFSQATVILLDPETLIESDETLKNEILKIHDFIGGSCIKFNNVKKKIKILIE